MYLNKKPAKHIPATSTTSFIHLFLLTIILFTGCVSQLYAQENALVHKSFGQRLKVLHPFYRDTLGWADSAIVFKKINYLKKLAQENDDDDLLMETEVIRVNYYYYQKDCPPTVALPMMQQLSKTAARKNKKWAEVLAESMMAIYYDTRLQEYELSFEHYQRVYDLLKDMSPEEFPYKQFCLTQIGNLHYFFGNYREALYYLLQSLEADPPFDIYKPQTNIPILNTIGLAYQKLNILDSSEYYLQRCYNEAIRTNATEWQGISSGNLGYNAFLRHEYDRAIPLLEKDVEIATIYADWGLASGSLMTLGNIYLNLGNISKANETLQQARQYVYLSGQYERFQHLYPLLSKLYMAEGQYHLSAVFLDSAFYVKDSVARKLNGLQILRAQQKVALERINSQKKILESRRKIYVYQRNTAVVIIIITMLFFILFFRQQRQKTKRQEEELANAARHLDDFARNITEKNMLIEMLEQHNNQENENSIQQLRKSTILTDDDWAYFRDLFEKVHPGYFRRLDQKLPGLSPAEIRYMTLSKLGLSNKEMAAMLGISTVTIRTYRSRLRKKLDLTDEDDFDKLTINI